MKDLLENLDRGTLEVKIPQEEDEFRYLENLGNMLKGYGYKVLGKMKDDNNQGRYHVSFEKEDKDA